MNQHSLGTIDASRDSVEDAHRVDRGKEDAEAEKNKKVQTECALPVQSREREIG
jgi:hypothetical protein